MKSRDIQRALMKNLDKRPNSNCSLRAENFAFQNGKHQRQIIDDEPTRVPLIWSWSLEGGNQRIKRASIFFTRYTEEVEAFKNAIQQNLGFETDCIMKNSVADLEMFYNRVNGIEKYPGCFLTAIFAEITERDKEVCVRFDDSEIPIGEIIHQFLGPENDKWIGKPKLFFVLEQSPPTHQYDNLIKTKKKLDVIDLQDATYHSGWLVLVVRDNEIIKPLIEILNSDDLKQYGTSLQEKIYDLLLHQKIGKNNNTLLVSTLQYLLNFPDLPRNFVKPTFSAEVERKTVDYDELLNDWAKGIDRNFFRLLSSPAGSGKTTVMKEIAHGLRKLNKTIVEVNLRDLVYKNFSKWNSETPIAEILAEAMKFPQAHVQALVNKKILILFLDGFDEICPDHGEKMLDLAKRMFDEEIQIFISTRPQEKKAIVDKLGQKNCFAYEILPFNRQQQIELLKLELNECELEMKLKKFEAADISDILANPLHLSLIAQCQDVENLYQIYDEIVRIKIETALKHKKSIVDAKIGEMSQNIIKLMQKLALKYLKLPQEDDQNPRNDIILQRIMSKSRSAIITLNQDVDVLVSDVGVDIDFNLINSTGIVTISGENMKFTHQTFAEFLVAKMFVECDDKNTCSIFCGTNRFWQSRKFVDRFLAQKNHSGENGINIEKTASFFRNEISSESKRADKKNEFLNNIVRDNLVNIFSIVKTVLSLEENDAKLFVPDTLQILGSAFFHGCEDVALELLEMGALKFIQNVSQYLHRWWRLVAANNSLRLFAKLKEKCLELFENSQPVPGMEEIILDAALFGQHQMLQLLLDNGFNVNFQGFGGKNALHVAVEQSYVECVEVLLNYKVLETASSSMVEQNLNLEAKDASGRSALIYAVENDQLILVKMLIEKGADVRVRFEDKHVIHFVKSVAVAKYLLGKDAELVKDLSGRESALHSAVLLGDMELCKLFVSSGVDVNAKDARGDNALFKACDHHAPNTEIIKFLVDSGTDLNHKSSVRGETVLHRAAKFSDSLEVLKLLTENMQEIFTTDDFGNNALMYALDGNREENIEYLLGRNFDLRWSNASGKTALHIAAEKCLLKFLEKLIDLGADVEAKDSDGASVMHWATHNNDVSVAKFLHQNYGGLINQRDNAGALPWHYTAKFSTLDLLSWFADNSEDVKATDNNGQDVLSYLDLREGCDSMDRYLFSISITSIQESQNSTPLACNGCRTETSSQSAPAPSKGPRRQVSRPSATCWPPFLSLFFSFVVFLLFIPLGNSTSDSRQVC
ncbi:uncharacterized protein LOC132204199 isoform X2 [Neocloeon triangulifer]|uniref:uncharacterized protein LOC132204199 isoform X2 n=1 Tax=Neocloeon triangulifer TaxID=2078957 RepID=UPI00286ED5A3|nr:uncharacterized protein LOC132204199 isoform X2 [Neocloeon triangulifer]